ncbi:hypothetical protein ACWDFL_27445 [Streptomyces bungoensis]
METLHLVLNAVTVIFIAVTMFAAGLGATVSALHGVFTNVPLLVLALIANIVVVPLLGWGIGALRRPRSGHDRSRLQRSAGRLGGARRHPAQRPGSRLAGRLVPQRPAKGTCGSGDGGADA